MIKTACLLEKQNGRIASLFSESGYVQIFDAECGALLTEFPRGALSDTAFARKLAEEDPEAIITGEINQEPFEILAEEYGITRYDGAGLEPQEAIRLMNRYKLRIIPDYIGGTGCHSGGECHEH